MLLQLICTTVCHRFVGTPIVDSDPAPAVPSPALETSIYSRSLCANAFPTSHWHSLFVCLCAALYFPPPDVIDDVAGTGSPSVPKLQLPTRSSPGFPGSPGPGFPSSMSSSVAGLGVGGAGGSLLGGGGGSSLSSGGPGFLLDAPDSVSNPAMALAMASAGATGSVLADGSTLSAGTGGTTTTGTGSALFSPKLPFAGMSPLAMQLIPGRASPTKTVTFSAAGGGASAGAGGSPVVSGYLGVDKSDSDDSYSDDDLTFPSGTTDVDVVVEGSVDDAAAGPTGATGAAGGAVRHRVAGAGEALEARTLADSLADPDVKVNDGTVKKGKVSVMPAGPELFDFLEDEVRVGAQNVHVARFLQVQIDLLFRGNSEVVTSWHRQLYQALAEVKDSLGEAGFVDRPGFFRQCDCVDSLGVSRPCIPPRIGYQVCLTSMFQVKVAT